MNKAKRLIQTPCVKICEIDRTHGLCKGCGRTLDEIARWGSMSAAERDRIMVELPQRTKTCAAPSIT